MFAVTKRLLLRPGWIEEAPALTEAIADPRIARNTARMPWPYTQEDAEEFLAREADWDYPSFQIIDRTVDPVRMIGGIGFMDGGDAPEIGYWITPDSWGRGYATEAGRAAIAAARASLGYRRIVSGHFVDNPASGRVLEKLGFRRTGRIEPRHSVARRREVDCVMFELDEGDMADIEPRALAA
ncbi:MAG: GNAT family protein [Pseudomonadota bacterium]